MIIWKKIEPKMQFWFNLHTIIKIARDLDP